MKREREDSVEIDTSPPRKGVYEQLQEFKESLENGEDPHPAGELLELISAGG